MNQALHEEIEKQIPLLEGNLFPTNAPLQEALCLVYTKDDFEQEKTLDGFRDRYEVTYLLHVLDTDYLQTYQMTENVRVAVIGFLQREIGENEKVFIENVRVNKVAEDYQFEIKKNRGIVDVTFEYKKIN